MENTQVKIISMCNLQNSYKSHNALSRMYAEMKSFAGNTLILDFANVTFISANQFSVLGCIISSFQADHPNTLIQFANIKPNVGNIMKVNGFGKHLALESKPDTYNTSIEYKIFNVLQIDAFEKYVTISIFGRSDIPQMSNGAREKIIDNILEIFNNVKEHTSSSTLRSCGQYFPKTGLLYFTITDSGETIPYNVSSYLHDHNIEIQTTTLEWAMQSGNSTRRTDAPGGLGLYFLSDFISLNKGELYIVSGIETFEQNKRGIRYKLLDYNFPGTIVTMAFNLNDTSSYCLSSEKESDFLF